MLIGERIFTDTVDFSIARQRMWRRQRHPYLLQKPLQKRGRGRRAPGEKLSIAALRYQGYRGGFEEAGVEF